jgi:uncharacterized membrane protein
MAKPMIFYAGIYNSAEDAEPDYQAIEALHGLDAIGSYDSAIIVHDPDGGVKVTETKKPVKHGAWIGVAAGAGAAVVFPFLLREVGDWDEAEQDALDSIARAQQDAVV